MIRFLHLACALVPAFLLAGCATTHQALPERDPRSVTITRGSGLHGDWNSLVAETSAADVVFIGENHGHPLGLAAAATLFDEIAAARPTAALSLEFFDRDQQSRLDDYLGGLSDEKSFKAAATRSEGNYPEGHRRMVETAKAKGLPVIASNAPRVYVRTARTDGYDKLSKLTPEQKRLFRLPDELPTGKYRTDFDEVMSDAGSHGGPPPKKDAPVESPEEKQKKLDASFRSQSLWDWTMADSIAKALDQGRRPVVQVVGRFHSDHRGGLVQALEKMHPGVKVVTVSFAAADSTSLREEDKGRADFVVYAGPAPEEK